MYVYIDQEVAHGQGKQWKKNNCIETYVNDSFRFYLHFTVRSLNVADWMNKKKSHTTSDDFGALCNKKKEHTIHCSLRTCVLLGCIREYESNGKISRVESTLRRWGTRSYSIFCYTLHGLFAMSLFAFNAFPWIFYMKPTFNCWFSCNFFFLVILCGMLHSQSTHTSQAPFYSFLLYFFSFFLFAARFFFTICNIDTYCHFVAIEIFLLL